MTQIGVSEMDERQQTLLRLSCPACGSTFWAEVVDEMGELVEGTCPHCSFEGIGFEVLETGVPQMLSAETSGDRGLPTCVLSAGDRLYLQDLELVEVEQILAEFHDLDLRAVSIEEVRDLLGPLLYGYTHPLQPLRFEHLFRARSRCSETALFENVAELWYPPPELVRQLGRLNREGVSLFYGAFNPDVALIEIRPRVGDLVAILECQPRKGTELRVTSLGTTFLGAEEVYTDDEVRVRMEKVQLFLAHEFTRVVDTGEEHAYKPTIAIAELFLDYVPECDGVYYPSIAVEKKSANVAICRESADRVLVPTDAWELLILEQTAPLRYQALCLRKASGIEADGRIRWHQ